MEKYHSRRSPFLNKPEEVAIKEVTVEVACIR